MKIRINRKLVIIGAIVVVIAVLAATAAHVIYENIYTCKLTVVVAPQTAEVKINGKNYDNGEYRVESGEYHVEINKEGFESVTTDITITPENPGEVYYALKQTDGTNSWYEEHPEDAEILDPIISYENMQNAERIAREYPLTTRLPFTIEYNAPDYSSFVHYEVSYDINEDNTVTVVIRDYTGGNKDDAYQKIRDRGYNPEDYDIRYEDHTSDNEWGYAGN